MSVVEYVWDVSFGSKSRENANGDRLAYELESVQVICENYYRKINLGVYFIEWNVEQLYCLIMHDIKCLYKIIIYKYIFKYKF